MLSRGLEVLSKCLARTICMPLPSKTPLRHELFDQCWQVGTRSKSPDGRPVKVRIGHIGLYVLSGSKSARTIFKSSKSVSKDSAQEMLFRNSGMKKSDLNVFIKDTSGVSIEPRIDLPEEQRIRKHVHTIGHNFLANSSAVESLSAHFLEVFNQQLDTQAIGDTITVPIYQFLKTAMFQASSDSILGTQISKMNPDFVKNFWDYDDAFLTMAIGVPKFLYGKGYQALENILDASKSWIELGWEEFDQKDKEKDWERNFGSRWIRELIFALEKAGVSREGQSIAMLSLIWA